MKSRGRRISARLAAGALVVACVLTGPTSARGQQAQKVSLPAVAGKYTEQHHLEVGDAPGHVIRISELHRLYDKDAPQIAGIRIKESWNRSLWDVVDLNGNAIVYSTYVVENGDRFFCKGTLTAQGVATSSGKKQRYLATLHITGGTGKLQGIRGVVTLDGGSDFSGAANQSRGGDIEYWFDGPATNAPGSAASKTATTEPG